MLTVEEYKSGKIFKYMRQIDAAVKLLDIPLIKNTVHRKLTRKLEKHRGDFILASQENFGCNYCYERRRRKWTFTVNIQGFRKAT